MSLGYKISTRAAPNWLVWMAGVFDPVAKNLRTMLDFTYKMDTQCMRDVLGISRQTDRQTYDVRRYI